MGMVLSCNGHRLPFDGTLIGPIDIRANRVGCCGCIAPTGRYCSPRSSFLVACPRPPGSSVDHVHTGVFQSRTHPSPDLWVEITDIHRPLHHFHLYRDRILHMGKQSEQPERHASEGDLEDPKRHHCYFGHHGCFSFLGYNSSAVRDVLSGCGGLASYSSRRSYAATRYRRGHGRSRC